MLTVLPGPILLEYIINSIIPETFTHTLACILRAELSMDGGCGLHGETWLRSVMEDRCNVAVTLLERRSDGSGDFWNIEERSNTENFLDDQIQNE
jgi:hypothetical protein